MDWADGSHQVLGQRSRRQKDSEMKVMQSAAGPAELGRWLRKRKAEEIELWAAIEKPHGRIVISFWITERCLSGQSQSAGSG